VLHAPDGVDDGRLGLRRRQPVDDVGVGRVLDDADARVVAADREEARGADEELEDLGPLGRQDARRVVDEEHEVERRLAFCTRRRSRASPPADVTARTAAHPRQKNVRISAADILRRRVFFPNRNRFRTAYILQQCGPALR